MNKNCRIVPKENVSTQTIYCFQRTSSYSRRVREVTRIGAQNNFSICDLKKKIESFEILSVEFTCTIIIFLWVFYSLDWTLQGQDTGPFYTCMNVQFLRCLLRAQYMLNICTPKLMVFPHKFSPLPFARPREGHHLLSRCWGCRPREFPGFSSAPYPSSPVSCPFRFLDLPLAHSLFSISIKSTPIHKHLHPSCHCLLSGLRQ